MPPLVSVVVAAYNEEVHVAECLESLLAQTYQPLEVLLCDDGSGDRTLEIARRHAGATALEFPHRGKGPTVNAGVEHARGEIVVFADADLIYDPRYVETLVGPIIRGECEGTSHATEYVANPENRWSRCLQVAFGLPPEVRLRLSDAEIAEGTPIFRALRRDAFLRVRGFEDTGFTDDQSLAPKLGIRARFVREAACSHYNPETLREIFGRGRWSGKSAFLAFGPKAAVSHLPPFTLVRAARAARRTLMWEMIPFTVAEDLGIALGILENALAARGS